jgi:transposase InsO family protein
MSSLTAPKKEQLRSFYYDVLKGGKLEKTWQRVQREFPGEYTRKQVKEFIDSQASAQETKQFRRNLKNFTSIHAKKAGEIFQIDLMFFSGGAVGPQRWAGALVCVDVYSRYAWAELVKQDPKPKNHNRGTPWRMARAGGKGQKSVLDAFKAVLQRSGGRVPKHVNMDEGNEFTNNLFQSFLQEKDITPHYSNKFTFMKNPIAERFNRTLRDAMQEFKATGKSQFEAVKALQDIVKNYNRDVHSTTKERPVDVWRGKRENQQKRNNPEFDFGEGDRVRLLERQSDFRKSGKYKWST